ncbi:MAG: ThuA domain-containing protein [Proteobacteria bacterium]|nr:ThuA domain-containing protein [Pseudomonadota bacterium]
MKVAKFLAVALAVLVVAGVALWASPFGRSLRGAMGLIEPVYDTEAPEWPAGFGEPDSVSVLVFSKTNGFRHAEAIPAAEERVREIAARRGWRVFATENGAVFEEGRLAQVDVVVGNNCTGDNWSPAQKQAFRRWVEGGGAFVGVHGAGGTRHAYWDWYQKTLIGAGYLGHPMGPQFQRATLRVENPDHPATRHLEPEWEFTDEWYSFLSNPRARGANVLVTLDESTYSPRMKMLGRDDDLSMGPDHPIVWSHCLGEGRAFFSALGHRAEAYSDPRYARMIEGALVWAAGLEGDCSYPLAPAEGD